MLFLDHLEVGGEQRGQLLLAGGAFDQRRQAAADEVGDVVILGDRADTC